MDSKVGLDTHVYCGDGMRRNTNMGNVKLEEYVQNGTRKNGGTKIATSATKGGLESGDTH